MKYLAVCCALLWACATLTTPYTSEYPVGDWSPQLGGDGNPKELVVTNPTATWVHVDVVCISEHVMPWETDVGPHAEVRVMIQVLNVDQYQNDCSVVRWYVIPPDHAKHGMQLRVWRDIPAYYRTIECVEKQPVAGHEAPQLTPSQRRKTY